MNRDIVSYCVGMLYFFVSGCATTTQGAKFSGNGEIGEFYIKWASISAFQNEVPKGLTPVIFIFSSKTPQPDNGVTEEDWIKEAERLGMSVSTTKNTVHGGSAYKGPDGNLRTCTISAIQRGLCGRKLGLSVQNRVTMAKAALESRQDCKWVSFKPRYNAFASVQTGADQYTLHVPLKCSLK